nr:hypothetical protein OH820_05190 [Streptomyces sp. NBC_00857]
MSDPHAAAARRTTTKPAPPPRPGPVLGGGDISCYRSGDISCYRSGANEEMQ